MNARLATGVAALCILCLACGGAAVSAPSTVQVPTSAVVETAEPVSATAPPPGQASTGRPVATPDATTATPNPTTTDHSNPPVPASVIRPGDVVETVVDNVRVRSRPRVKNGSAPLEPKLRTGTKLLVLDGPVAGSGYAWYWVSPLSSRRLPGGWVAVAGRDGEAWLGPSKYDCPNPPADLRSLLRLPSGVGLLCFPGKPITVTARLFDCNCDPTPGSDWIVPSWLFAYGDGAMLTDPTAVRLDESADLERQDLLLDPEGTYPDPLPVGEYVEGTTWTAPDPVRVTGMFDHPAARTCTWESNDPVPSSALPLDPPVAKCRLEFAVTRIEAVR